MSERNDESLMVRIALVTFAVFVMLYSLLITQRVLFGVIVVLGLFGVYLAWRFFRLAVRFVAAVERIADALEESERR